MKLILVLGTSLSAAGMAAGFALIANQALSRESAKIAAPYRATLPSRVVPDLGVPPISAQRAPLVQDRPAENLSLAAVATSGNAAINQGETQIASEAASSALLPAQRPPRRPVQVALADPAPVGVSGFAAAGTQPAGVDAPVVGQQRSIPAENFKYLPLIGVYR
ncbi:MAG: hypothetical protein DI616_01910 [Paracoccus denitrificans]|uniref:Uncharacterized protein n=1 Tax=Paracoccus denitrificans TaxID=266 RepID=A0A533IDD5_PARDE|nr:MAG: hypothetical protein DI616_01910 [Paracoccus denitrificans]